MRPFFSPDGDDHCYDALRVRTHPENVLGGTRAGPFLTQTAASRTVFSSREIPDLKSRSIATRFWWLKIFLPQKFSIRSLVLDACGLTINVRFWTIRGRLVVPTATFRS